jgi:type II secretory pathway pseudopilin PulG
MDSRMPTPSMHEERSERGRSPEPDVDGSELPKDATGRRDSGTTLIEILVSIVLIGTAVVATLGALRISVIGGTIHRDHANAHAWLQSASDVLYASEKEDCDTSLSDGGKSMIIATYQPVVDAVANPEGWANTQIQVVDLEFWNATDTDGDGIVEYRFGSVCQDSINLSLQRVTLEVRSPDGRIIEQVELVK